MSCCCVGGIAKSGIKFVGVVAQQIMRRCVAGLWRAWLCALLARCGVAFDGSVELIGSTSEAFPSCATYGTAYCAENGTKIMVVDASENFLIA